MTAVISAVATLAIAAGAWFGWQHYADQDRAEQLRDIALQVKNSMQHKFETDSNLNKFIIMVESVELIRVTDVKYEGMASVKPLKSPDAHQIKIDVTADGEHMMWESAPGSMAFLFTDSLKDDSNSIPGSGPGLRALN